MQGRLTGTFGAYKIKYGVISYPDNNDLVPELPVWYADYEKCDKIAAGTIVNFEIMTIGNIFDESNPIKYAVLK
jgi:hypothetical protein